MIDTRNLGHPRHPAHPRLSQADHVRRLPVVARWLCLATAMTTMLTVVPAAADDTVGDTRPAPRVLSDDAPGAVPGYRSIQVPAPHHERPLDGALWYPTPSRDDPVAVHGNPVFEPVPARIDAPVSAGRWPVVLLSHGLGGHHRTLSWLGAGLAVRGAIVIALDHPNSTVGDNDMRRGLDHGTRVADLSAALDWLSGAAGLADRLDPARLHAAGFSYGGWTALSMGGLRGNLAGYAAHCAEVGDASTHCADIARAGVTLASLDAERWNADYRDERITAVAAIDPGPVYGLAPADARSMVGTVQLISLGGGADRLLATDYDRSGLATLLPHAGNVNVSPAAHFSVLPMCRPAGAGILKEEGDDPVCDDPAGGDRSAVHARIIDALADAFAIRTR